MAQGRNIFGNACQDQWEVNKKLNFITGKWFFCWQWRASLIVYYFSQVFEMIGRYVSDSIIFGWINLIGNGTNDFVSACQVS